MLAFVRGEPTETPHSIFKRYRFPDFISIIKIIWLRMKVLFFPEVLYQACYIYADNPSLGLFKSMLASKELVEKNPSMKISFRRVIQLNGSNFGTKFSYDPHASFLYREVFNAKYYERLKKRSPSVFKKYQ
jgi:hypothetical protein